jgi:glycosyltransferase involved in cell wall biosynthesis
MANSGYARMADVLEGHVISTPKQLPLFHKLVAKVLLPLATNSGSQWYHRHQLLTEFKAAYRWIRRRNQIFHFLYGENSYRYLGILKKLRPDNAIVCTYHTPPEKFQSVVRDRTHLESIDAVIVFSKEQVDFFSDLLGERRVYHIPHGVDVDYFAPREKSLNHNGIIHCLFVGQHLRDFDTLAKAAGRLENKAKNLRFSIVTPKDKHHYFKNLSNVDLYHAIPDAQLLDLYQTSDIFILPLLKTTANCAVQEAMACGLPIVSTELAAVHEYMDASCALFAPSENEEAFAEAIFKLYKNDGLRSRMSVASRRKTLMFSLNAIAAKTKQVYADIFRQKRVRYFDSTKA